MHTTKGDTTDGKPATNAMEQNSEGVIVTQPASPTHDGNDSSEASQSGGGGKEVEFWACVQDSMPYTCGISPKKCSSAHDTFEEAMLKEARLRVPRVNNPSSAMLWVSAAGVHLRSLVKKYNRAPPAIKRELLALKGARLLARRTHVNKKGKLVFRKIVIVPVNHGGKTVEHHGEETMKHDG